MVMPTPKLHHLWDWYPMAAITLGKHIFVKDKYLNDAVLLGHEFVHVRQMTEMGVVLYLLRYLLLLPLFWNPFRVRMEVEAYRVQMRAGIPVEWCAAQLSSWKYGWPCRKATAAKMLEATT